MYNDLTVEGSRFRSLFVRRYFMNVSVFILQVIFVAC